MDDRANVIVGGGDAGVVAVDPVESAPALICDAGAAARFAWDEFLYGRIRNPFTRKAYLHLVRLFFRWMDLHGLDLARVTPGHVGRYFDGLPVAAPTKKLHLSALRRFFDELVLRHVIVLNPALSVRSERHQVDEGKTSEISVKHARQLMHSICTANEVGQRDRAVIGVLIYTAERVGAVARLCRRDFYEVAEQYCLRFHEKGGKIREIPVRHDLQVFLQEYLERSGLLYADPSSPMFRTTVRRSKRLTMNRLTADDMARMMKRRLRDVGLSTRLSPHSLRVTTITDLLEQGVPLFCAGIDLRLQNGFPCMSLILGTAPNAVAERRPPVLREMQCAFTHVPKMCCILIDVAGDVRHLTHRKKVARSVLRSGAGHQAMMKESDLRRGRTTVL